MNAFIWTITLLSGIRTVGVIAAVLVLKTLNEDQVWKLLYSTIFLTWGWVLLAGRVAP